MRGSPATASVVDLPPDCGRECACGQEVWRTFTKKQHNGDGPGFYFWNDS